MTRGVTSGPLSGMVERASGRSGWVRRCAERACEPPRSRVPSAPTARAQAGFTLLEIVVVLAVLATLAGAVVPLVTASRRAEAHLAARAELQAIADALERFYYERGTFPAAVDDPAFLGDYALGGVGGDRVRDEWGARAPYRLALAANPDVATVYSVGDDGVDAGAANEPLQVRVHGSRPGGDRTRERMHMILAALAQHLDAGGRVTGDWTVDRAALGLGAEYERDGFGVPFTLEAATLLLRSAGADRVVGTADDITS